MNILIKTDGFSIETQDFRSYEEAYKVMKTDYNSTMPEELDSFSEEMSGIADTSAILYANGKGVYLWKIIEVQTEPLTDSEKDNIYRQRWQEAVYEDTKGLAESEGVELSDEQAGEIARLYVGGRYDCNHSYWTNIRTLINEITTR